MPLAQCEFVVLTRTVLRYATAGAFEKAASENLVPPRGSPHTRPRDRTSRASVAQRSRVRSASPRARTTARRPKRDRAREARSSPSFAEGRLASERRK